MIRGERLGEVLVLHLEHGKANVLDLELLAALEERLDSPDEARVLVFVGRGSIFSAGVDLRRLVHDEEGYADRFVRRLTRVFHRLLEVPVPMVAAINGHAIAGGAVLAAACDLRLMSEGEGRIGIPELLVGVPFPPVVLETVRFAWPGAGLSELVFSGRTVTASEALARGLVDALVPAEKLLEEALTRADAIASLDPESTRLAKSQLRQPLLERIRKQEQRFGSEVRRIWSAPETRERIASYLERTLGR